MDRSSTIQQKQSPISEPIIDDASTDAPLALQAADDKFITDAALLVTQGKHRFYSMVLPSDVLAATCTADTRQENPIDGFQRLLDKRRARDIADYIDSGFGSAPCAIILSAQPRAQLHYDRASQILQFRKNSALF